MKTLKNISFVILTLILFTTCDISKMSEELSEEQVSLTIEQIEQENSAQKKSLEGKNKIPFAAKFFSEGGVQPGEESEEICGQPPIFLNVQQGDGVGTYLGKFTYSATFCVDATDLLDGTLEGDDSVPYFDNEKTTSYMMAENGDKLFLGATKGVVLPATTPGFDFEFHDPFTITGGTGRFKGARGKGISSGLVTQSPERTEHIWTGKIKLRNNKDDD